MGVTPLHREYIHVAAIQYQVTGSSSKPHLHMWKTCADYSKYAAIPQKLPLCTRTSKAVSRNVHELLHPIIDL